MPTLFLSYRRGDNADTVKLLHERLKSRLRGWEIFYDHQSIPQGEDFPTMLRQKVTTADAVLVIIGPKWLDTLKERAAAPSIDHLREEVRLALEAGHTVIPVTIGNTRLPKDLADFPDLQPLLKHNGRDLRPDPQFDADLARILDGLRAIGPDDLAGSMLADRYKIIRKIAEGGMGVVYLAEQTHPVKRTVALKLIKPGMDSRDVLARFDVERQALAVMDHPNISKVLDAGIAANGRPFFVMEYVKGVPITEYCDDKKLTPQDRLNLFIPVCNAVQHAHQKGIIHRDIKPTNVLVEVIDGKPVPKVIDFGLAKALGQKLTDKTLVTEFDKRVGTLEYSAPEQAAGRSFDVDTRSDIYSLGVLLYELLTGAPPFMREDLLKVGEEEMRRFIREEVPVTPSKKLSSSGELPAIAARRHLEPGNLVGVIKNDLDWIVMKCLEKERERRYETANQLGQELQRYLADEPVQAGPPSVGYLAMKFLRRNRGLVTAAALIAVALVVGIFGTGAGFLREASQREIAEENERDAKAAREQERLAKLKALAAAAAEKSAAEKALAAADGERKANAKSQKRLAQIKQANVQLQSIFAHLGSRATEKGGPPLFDDAELRKLLEKMGDALSLDFVDDATSLGHLQLFLGNALSSLGNTKKGIELLTKGCASLEKSLGAGHPETLNGMNNLALAYHSDGQLKMAMRLYAETLEKMKSDVGTDDRNTLTTMNNLALAYEEAGMLAKALPLLEQTLAKRKAKFGPDDPDTLRSMKNLALAMKHEDKGPDRQESIVRAQAFLSPVSRGKYILGFVHFGAKYNGHAFQRKVGVKNMPDHFALVYRFKWENDGLTDLAFLCDAEGEFYNVQVTYTNAFLSQPFALANASVNVIAKEIERQGMTPSEKQETKKLIDDANARGLLEMSLKLQQASGK